MSADGRHKCHASGCEVETQPKLFMCLRHWRRLPRSMRDEIWFAYRPGQEIDKRPSAEYLVAARAAIEWMAKADARREKVTS